MHPDELLRHGAFLRTLATSLLRGEEGVDDVVQDAYVRALERQPRHPRAWLGKVARNLVFRRWRSRARTLRRERAAAQPEAVPGPENAVARLEIQRKVVDAVLALEEPYRSVVVRRYFDGLSPREIARESGVPYETARTRLGRALAQLRKRLDSRHEGWAPALVPLALRPPQSAVLGGLIVSIQKKLFLCLLPLLGVVVGVAGHAALTASSSDGARSVQRRPEISTQTSLVPELREQVRALKQENLELRRKLEARAGAEPATPRTTAAAGDGVDWRALLPLLRAVARRKPGQELEPALAQQLNDLIQTLAKRHRLRDGMQMQDLWRLPAVGGAVALAFARELQPGIDPAVRDEIAQVLERAEGELPPDPLEIELLAAIERGLTETEAVLGRVASSDVARRALAEVTPLWRRHYWQTLRLGTVNKGELQEIVSGMVGALPEEDSKSVEELVGRMAEEFRAVRTRLAMEHGEDAVRAVLLERGPGRPDEAVLERRRARDDFPAVQRQIRAAVAAHQAKFERQYFKALPPAAREGYTQIAATLLLFDLAE
ncbi:MAG: RNA polymerase sigma factor [Planctomycetota bacterium]|jgi:RNA polymerase sigma-70 factor (ECF subfamily)